MPIVVTNAVHSVEHQFRQDDLSMRFGMPTPSHGPQKSLTLQEVYAWLYALQCKRLELRMQALVISFLALSRNGFWCINLLLIFGHSGEKPRYGKNSRLLQGFPTSPRHVKLTWGHLVTVPWPKPLQRHVGMLLTGGNEPQGPSGGHE